MCIWNIFYIDATLFTNILDYEGINEKMCILDNTGIECSSFFISESHDKNIYMNEVNI